MTSDRRDEDRKATVTRPINIDRYRSEGYLELGRRLGAEDLAAVTGLLDRLDAQEMLPDTWEAQYDQLDGERRLRKVRRLLWNQPALFATILQHADVPEIAESVLGPGAVAVFHAAFLKPAKIGTHVGLHQDQALWSRDYPGAFSVWIALTNVEPANGGLAGRPFSHRTELLHTQDPGHPWHPTLHAIAHELTPEHQFLLQPGEAVMWDRRFAHSSGPNRSEEDRRGMVVVFANGETEGFDPADVMTLPEIRRHAVGQA